MPAGVEAAKLFLSPGAKVISEVKRDGVAETFLSEGVGSETKAPLFLLVDGRTASASEIMAAALQDNKRAFLIGPSKTFGEAARARPWDKTSRMIQYRWELCKLCKLCKLCT